jgi:hypothetical protein
MLKLFKIAVTGLDTSDSVIGRNVDYKTTMGYNEETQEIHVLVENIHLPELGAQEADLREDHTDATFTTAAERTFTPADFPKISENMKWMVEFDAETKTIKDPIDVYTMTINKISDSQTARRVPRFLKERWDDMTIPLFSIDSFYKNAEGFSTSVLTFFEYITGNELVDDVITNTDVQVVTQKEKEFWLIGNANTNVFFEVLDEEGKIVSSLIHTTKQEAKSTSFVEMLPLNLDPENTYPTDTPGGNQYKVSLPVQDTYTVRVIYTRHLGEYLPNGRTIPSTFDVICVNGVANKSRSLAGLNKAAASYISFDEQHTSKPDGQKTCSGVDNIRVSTSGLVAGEYVKLKLDLGEFKSYAELWIDLV